MAAQAQTYSVLYGFTGTTDGAHPDAGLIRDSAGNLYGTTQAGGVSGCTGCGFGLVFKLDPAGNLTVLHTFMNGADGGVPRGGLTRDSAGNLYGTTYTGGASAGAYNGVVFKIDSTGSFSVQYTFTGGADGGHPTGGVISDSARNLYGTTSNGGGSGCFGSGCGVVFKLDPAGNFTVLYTFAGGVDGGNPAAGVIRDSAGNLYSTTPNFGSNGHGLCFKLDPAGNLTVLHSFTGGADGAQPLAGVIRDPAGNLYGTTHYGGGSFCANTGYNCGVVYWLDSAGNLKVLHSFTGRADGAQPTAGVILDAVGNLYGATPTGGASNDAGVVFKLDAAGNFSVLHAFARATDGMFPAGGLLRWAGYLYGTTSTGGPNSQTGVVFRLR
jgi:uncharacterized repeat protein (TIGR03803 family)